MGLATFAVAFVPTYASIGIWGAILLTLLDKYPDSTTAQLHEHLVEEYERAVSVGRLSQVLRVLRARGQITSPRRSGAARHRVRR